MHIDFPYHFDGRGRTAETTSLDQIRDMIEQVLFTEPYERVNRPDFGCGLSQFVHECNSPELAETLEVAVRAALDRWVGDVIEVLTLRVTSIEASLIVEITYRIRRTGEEGVFHEPLELEPQA